MEEKLAANSFQSQSMSEKEKHPYLEIHPLTKAYKYLVIGTMPPARELPPGTICKKEKKRQRNFKIDYYYGNVASFWKLMNQLYPSVKFDTIADIQKWQGEYSIGITDTVIQCRRKDPCSYKDSDLIIDWTDYNHQLKKYILTHKNYIEKLIFTSGENCNNALTNFKKIMGDQFQIIANKVVSDLPSPSGGSNISNFNSDNATLGLNKDLYDYMLQMGIESTIAYVEEQWLKKQKSNKGEKINRIPKDMLTEFKVWKYKKIFPMTTCVS